MTNRRLFINIDLKKIKIWILLFHEEILKLVLIDKDLKKV